MEHVKFRKGVAEEVRQEVREFMRGKVFYEADTGIVASLAPMISYLIVRSSSHTLRFAKTGKREGVFKLLAEWHRVMQLICDDVWLNGYTWMEDDVFHEFNPNKFKYKLPNRKGKVT